MRFWSILLTKEIALERWMSRSLRFSLGVAVFVILFSLMALPGQATDAKTVNIYVDGQEKVVSTKAETVKEILNKLDIRLDEKDIVEPKPEAKIDASGFNINIFRARSVLILDKEKERKVVTAHQSPELIAKSAGMEVHEEDLYEMEMVTEIVEEEHVGQMLRVDRAVPVSLMFDGEKLDIRTQSETVGEFLSEQGVVVRNSDQLNYDLEEKITADMKIIVVRIGHSLETIEEEIDFDKEVIYDNSKPVGWSETDQPGKPGVRIVSYETNKKTGKKTELQSVVKLKPVKQIIKKGNKSPSSTAGGAFAQLRACESGGNYAANTGNGYYGAYQFSKPTWDAMGTGYSYPHQAPSTVQDNAAKQLQARSGWGQWPSCSAKLGL